MVNLKLEEVDSGMESFAEGDFGSEKLPGIEDDYENEADETLAERLIGLAEMFPPGVRHLSYNAVVGLKNGVKGLYGFSRAASWIFFSSSALLFAPLLFEIERVQVQAAQLNQQKQVLLGPNTAIASGGSPGMPMMPSR